MFSTLFQMSHSFIYKRGQIKGEWGGGEI